MDSSTTPNKKTSPASGEKKELLTNGEVRSIFMAAALSMGWQLAVVVVIPIVGGHEIDQHLHSSPMWEIIGFFIAILGFFSVLFRQLKDLNAMNRQGGHKK